MLSKSRLVILLLHLIVLKVALVFETSDKEKERKTIKTGMNFDTIENFFLGLSAQNLNSGFLQGAIEDRNHGYRPLERENTAILACLHLMLLDEQLTLRILYLNATECNLILFFLLFLHCLMGYGTFTLKMDFYESSSFTTPYTAQDYPLTVDLNEYVYLRYSVASSADLVIMGENCKATKDASFYSWPQYTFLQNGLVHHCAVIKHR